MWKAGSSTWNCPAKGLAVRRPSPAAGEVEPLRAATATGRPLREIKADALAVLQAYSWPGNVRELRNVIERLLIMAPDDPSKSIGIYMLPPEINADTPVSGNMEGKMAIMGLGLLDARGIF